LIEIILNFFTSQIDPETSEQVFTLKKIALNYLKGAFIINLITAFPYQLIT